MGFLQQREAGDRTGEASGDGVFIEGGKLQLGKGGVHEVTRAMNAGCFHLFSAYC